jgi:hypothetical protein
MVSIKYKRIGSPELQELDRMSTNRTTMRKTTGGTSNRLMSLKGVRRSTDDSVNT